MKFPVEDLFSKCDQTSVSCFLNEKLHFLCSDYTIQKMEF